MAGTAPIVIVTGTKDDDFAASALRAGAHDLIVKGELDPEQFRRVLSRAVLRHRHYLGVLQRVADVDAEEAATWLGSGGSTATSRALGITSLREAAPLVFEDLVEQYNDLVALSVERQVYKGAAPIDRQAERVGGQLGSVNAGPRDVIEIHLEAISHATRDRSVVQAGAYAREARVVLVQVMGYVAAYYRLRVDRRVNEGEGTPATEGSST